MEWSPSMLCLTYASAWHSFGLSRWAGPLGQQGPQLEKIDSGWPVGSRNRCVHDACIFYCIWYTAWCSAFHVILRWSHWSLISFLIRLCLVWHYLLGFSFPRLSKCYYGRNCYHGHNWWDICCILWEGLSPRKPMAEFVIRKKALIHGSTTLFSVTRLLFFLNSRIVVARITALLSVIILEQLICFCCICRCWCSLRSRQQRHLAFH